MMYSLGDDMALKTFFLILHVLGVICGVGGVLMLIGLIWRPGLVLMLAAMPFAAMASFLALDFAGRDWPGTGLAFAGFGTAYILVGSSAPTCLIVSAA